MFCKSLVIYFVVSICSARRDWETRGYNESITSVIYDNPNYIRDRFKDEVWKPVMDASWSNRFRKPYHPAWMDYCDPYHCNDYHKITCGLNRRNMKFRWFQSICHLILNNMCSTYRGALRYDVVDTKFCTMFVMHLRAGCPAGCQDALAPVCGVSQHDNHVVVFRNRCSLDAANCRGDSFQEYEEVNMGICAYYL